MTDTSQSFGAFHFGLSQDQEERAMRLHSEAIVVDMLFQGPCSDLAYDAEFELAIDRHRRNLGLAHSSARWDAALRWVEVAQEAPIRAALRGDGRLRAHWEESGVVGGNRQFGADLFDPRTWARLQLQFDALPWLVKGRRAADFRDAKQRGLRVGYLSSQQPGGLDERLTGLQDLHDFGLRMLGITYNMQNAFGGGCTERADAGLSRLGAQLVARANELGIIVDTSHSGRQTTLDACERSEQPVVASHTTADAVYPHDRAKGDDELEAIAATGGVIGINAVPFFLDDAENVTIDRMLDHIDHVVARVGWEHVGIGTDWPLQMDRTSLERFLPAWRHVGFRQEHHVSATTIAGFRDYRDFPNLTRGLVARGYGDEQIMGILGENFLRVFERVSG